MEPPQTALCDVIINGWRFLVGFKSLRVLPFKQAGTREQRSPKASVIRGCVEGKSMHLWRSSNAALTNIARSRAPGCRDHGHTPKICQCAGNVAVYFFKQLRSS